MNEQVNTTFRWRGSNGTSSQCWLRIFPRTGKDVVILTELSDNTGISVTNDAEHLGTLVLGEYDLSARSSIWIEHYPGSDEHPETFDLFQMNWDGVEFSWPRWCRLTPDEVNCLCGEVIAQPVQTDKV